MPKVRRRQLPKALYQHLLARIREREIPPDQLVLFAAWLDTEPEVPIGKWFKRFPSMTVCGEGELVKTFLRPGQVAIGDEFNVVKLYRLFPDPVWKPLCMGNSPRVIGQRVDAADDVFNTVGV